MTTNNFYQAMKDGTEVSVMRWIPDGEIKGVVQMSHGMGEHAARYDKMGTIFAEHGFVFCAHDHRGHGRTALKAQEAGKGGLGHLADKDGFNKVVSDLEEVLLSLKADYPNKKAFLIGHSFGSFVSQGFIEESGDLIDGVVLCGTAGPRIGLMRMAKFVFGISKFFGKRHHSNFCKWCAFGSYNKRVKNPKTEMDWLSRNEFNVEMYNSDIWCGTLPTAGFFHDLASGLLQIHAPAAMKRIPQNLPVYFIYGEEDPVGDYGKTIKQLVSVYKSNGMSDVEVKSWPEDRHEIFNEVDGDAVIEDTIKWLEKHL